MDARCLLGATAIIGAALLISPAAAQTETVLHNFDTSGHHKDGELAQSRLLLDDSGALYGTTREGSKGVYSGVAFELVQSGGAWTESVLVNLDGNAAGGLIEDSAGDLYGATDNSGTYSAGTVFELSQTGGVWTESVLHTFCPARFCRHSGDGKDPVGELVQDASSNLYGVTYGGGRGGGGTVFELSKDGGWAESILYNFACPSACRPAGIHLDSTGTIYGTTFRGGNHHKGTAFALVPANGTWNETVLASFGGHKGEYPNGGLDEDAAGNLYGTTREGGKFGHGVVFELSQAGGVWTETVLHSFKGAPDGDRPLDGVHIDSAATIFGTTVLGGGNNNGAVFKLTRSGGRWTESLLYSFAGSPDGDAPWARVVEDANNVLYGTTDVGGKANEGTVFQLTQ